MEQQGDSRYQQGVVLGVYEVEVPITMQYNTQLLKMGVTRAYFHLSLQELTFTKTAAITV